MAADALPDDIAQLVDAGAGGVDDQIGSTDDRIQQLPFAVDRLAQAETRRTERMLAAGLAKALEQDIVIGMQEDHFAAGAARTEIRCHGRQVGQVGGAVAGIDADRKPAVHRILRGQYLFDHRGQQGSRDVVDAVETQVFEVMQCHRLAGAGQAADDDQAHAIVQPFRLRARRYITVPHA